MVSMQYHILTETDSVTIIRNMKFVSVNYCMFVLATGQMCTQQRVFLSERTVCINYTFTTCLVQM
jgi:hypothetical protein